MRKTLILMFACMCLAFSANAQRNSGRLSLGVGLLYRNGMDVTFSYEHEMNYRHAWEFFANGYLQWAECGPCGHICPESFWRNYRTYGFGVAYKPWWGKTIPIGRPPFHILIMSAGHILNFSKITFIHKFFNIEVLSLKYGSF